MLPASRAATEAMDQHKEKEENNSQESADQREEEEEKDSEEYVDQRERDAEENNSEERTGQRKEEESSEEAMAASSLFAHPCLLLQYVVRVCSCCLGFRDSFSDPKPSAASDAPAPANSSQEGEEEDKKTREVITHVSAARRRPQPPGNPKEGRGGNGGQHN